MTNVFASRITTNSNEVYADTVRREKFCKGKLAMIYNGVDERRFARRDAAARLVRNELGIPDDHVVVTNVANLFRTKGLMEFVEAAAIVLNRYRTVTFFLWLGARSDVANILNDSDIQVLSSYAEGFSNAILEGMACSLPIVATRVGGNAEAVEEGRTGLIVPPKDSGALAEALLRLVPDRALRAAMGECGRLRVEELFTINQMAAGYMKLYSELLGEPWRMENGGERLSAEAGR
jgi:glycosyltransferase involved in cell wall biosynthesis